MRLSAILLHLALLSLAARQASTSDSSAICAATDSLSRLSEFFVRNSRKIDADGYIGASFAFMTFDAAPKVFLAVERRVADSCSDAQAMELRRSIDGLRHALDGFRARVVGAKSRVGGDYDSQTYFRICRPFEAVFQRLLSESRFRWRRLDDAKSEGGGHRSVEAAKAWLAASKSRLNSYNEAQGDACFKGLLAPRTRSGSSCRPTPACKRLFLNSQPSAGYTLTHQLMFWVASIDRSCNLKLSNGHRVDRSLVSKACRRALTEHRRILALGLAAGSELFDLALEQAVLCGVLGYRDFFTDSTMLLTRRLQDERLGCFPERLRFPESKDRNSTSTAAGTTGRKLMHNVVLDGICSSHTSGLAAAYFSLFLRAVPLDLLAAQSPGR